MTKTSHKKKVAKPSLRKKTRPPVWLGPESEEHGVTQSLISDFLVCRERFRVKVIDGWQSIPEFNAPIEYGSLFHECIEAHANGDNWGVAATIYCDMLMQKFPTSKSAINNWWRTIQTQFPVYLDYWESTEKADKSKSLMAEECFKVPYELPSGRIVYLRGKFDGVSLDKRKIWLKENKIKGTVDELKIENQLTFDLQTMIYTISLQHYTLEEVLGGVKYNIVRRPWSGGRGNIKPHKAKTYKNKPSVPAETPDEFYKRFSRDYLEAEPEYWFKRWEVPISQADINIFKSSFLDPFLEHLCIWYDFVTERATKLVEVPMNYRMPYGVWSPLLNDRGTDIDEYLRTGNTAGLQRVQNLYPELSEA